MPWLIAAIAAVALLLAFQQVVSRVAQQGAARRQAQTEHVQASWRCRALADARAREDCLAQLVPASAAGAAGTADTAGMAGTAGAAGATDTADSSRRPPSPR